jgi:hypothetical protein
VGLSRVASPSVALSTWLLAGFDPVLIAVAVYLGWTADQVGKIVIAAIASLAVSLLVAWIVTGLGLPSAAPIGRDYPTLIPVRALAAVAWATAAYVTRRLARPS